MNKIKLALRFYSQAHSFSSVAIQTAVALCKSKIEHPVSLKQALKDIRRIAKKRIHF